MSLDNLYNPVKFQGYRLKVKVLFCVRDAAATRGQYLALSKAR